MKIEDRVLLERHEWHLSEHDEDIQELKEANKALSDAIDGVNYTLVQIKHMVYGACLLYVLTSFGILEVIKGIIL